MSKEKKIDDFALYESLKLFECPFDWKFPECIFSHKEIAENKKQQLEEKIDLESKEVPKDEFLWRQYVFSTALSFYYFKIEKKEQAWQAIEKAYATIDATGIRDSFYESIKSSLFHIVLAMKGRYYFEDGDLLKAKEVADKIKRKDSMNDIEKAGLLGIKVSIFNEFGPDSSVVILDDIREAVRLNPEEAEWNFILGKVLRRIRKLATFFEIPSKEEICALENACKKKKCAAYSLYCAIAYKELSNKLFQKCGLEKFGEQIKGLNQKASDLFRETLQYDDLSAATLSKISRGLSELPYPFKDVDKAKELALKSVELNPTGPMTLHTLALFYERYELDFEKALEFNMKAFEHGSYGSGMDIIKINLRINPEYNPLPLICELKEKFQGKGHLTETTVQEACYYLIVKQDLDQALDILIHIIDNNPDLHALRICKPMWLHLKTPLSIYELLYHELKSSRNKSKSSAYMDALLKIKRNEPELFEKEVDENFLANLKEESRKNLANYAKRKPTTAWRRDNRDRDGNNQAHRFGAPAVSRERQRRSEDSNWRGPRQDTRNSEGDPRREHNSPRNYIPNKNNAYENRSTNRRSTQDGNQSRDSKSMDRNRNPKVVSAKTQSELSEKDISSTRKSFNSEDVSKENIKSSPPQEKSFVKKSVTTSSDKTEKENKNSLDTCAITRNINERKSTSSVTDHVEKNNKDVPHSTSKTSKTSDIQDRSLSEDNNSKSGSDYDSYNEDEVQSDEENYKKKFSQERILEKMKEMKIKLKQQPKSKSTFVECAKQESKLDLKEEKHKHQSSNSEKEAKESLCDEKPRVLEKTSEPATNLTNAKVPYDLKVSTDEDVIDQFSQLGIHESEKTSKTVQPEMKSSNEKETDGSEANPIAEQLKNLDKKDMKLLLKIIKNEKKKKKAKKVAENIEQDVEAVEDDSLPPPKITVITAGNQAIRQPKGPTEENNFSLARKS